MYEINQAPVVPMNDKASFFRGRCLSVIFRLRRLPRSQLKQACKDLGITWRELPLDMPVRWNSTDKFLKAMLYLEGAIRLVLRNQQWDKSVRDNLTLTDNDWEQLKEMERFFDLFRKPTIASQAEKYETLHNTIPDYLHILRQLNVWKAQDDQLTLQAAAEASYDVIKGYLDKALKSRHSCVALLCDPRYKLKILGYLYDAEGGENSEVYRRAKAHFQSVFSAYKRRETSLAEWDRQQAENAAPERSPTPEHHEGWRLDPFHGFDEFVASNQPLQQLPLRAGGSTEVDRWFAEPLLERKATPEEQRVYMQSKIYDFPIIAQMARDFTAIPATSAPSERVFSQAGNLVSKKRTRINSENIRYVLCLRAWGLLPDDDINDDEEEEEAWEAILDVEGRVIRWERRAQVPGR
jgi:hypothetical protein